MGSANYFGASHLKFRKCPVRKGRKLSRYKVINQSFHQEIGIIHWRGGWHQYVFQALPKVDMSISCHKEIGKFIEKLMKERKDGIKKD